MQVHFLCFLCVALLSAVPLQGFARSPDPEKSLGSSSSHQPDHPAAPDAQLAQLQQQNATMILAARDVAHLVDSHQLGELWDGASLVAQRAVPRETFIRQIEQDRLALGSVLLRGQGVVSRIRYGPGARVPQGFYVNVSFPTRFAKADQVVQELVSFRLDTDKTWRLSGYSVRSPIQ